MAMVTLMTALKQRRFFSASMAFVMLLAGNSLLTSCASGGSAPIENAWNNVDTTQTKHRVQPGETIYSIAWRYNLNYKDLAAWNNLNKPYYVNIGQVLRLTPPAGSETTAQAAAPTTDNTVSKIEPTPTFTPVSSTSQTTATSNNAPAKTAKATANKNAAAASTASTTTQTSGNGWQRPVHGKLLETYGENGNKGIDIAVPVGTNVKAAQAGTVVYAGSNLRGYGQLVIVKQKDDLMTAYAHNSKLLVSAGDTVKTGQVIALSGDSEAKQAMLHLEVRKAGKPVDPMPYFS